MRSEGERQPRGGGLRQVHAKEKGPEVSMPGPFPRCPPVFLGRSLPIPCAGAGGGTEA